MVFLGGVNCKFKGSKPFDSSMIKDHYRSKSIHQSTKTNIILFRLVDLFMRMNRPLVCTCIQQALSGGLSNPATRLKLNELIKIYINDMSLDCIATCSYLLVYFTFLEDAQKD